MSSKLDLFFPPIIAIVLGGIAYACATEIENVFWTIALTFVFGGLAAFALMLIKQYTIIIESKNGKVDYTCNDSIEECQGWVLATNERIQNAADT
ncbi:MAG: hypothetical protein HRU15_01825 [Planctomycetes bacterium]|nr:hypothetical protein [Planctomycetota bacterium]